MYRYLILGSAFALAITSAAWAGDPLWRGSAWYLVTTETGFDETIVSGPFGNEAQCNADKASRSSDPGIKYALCEYLSQDPGQ